MKNRGSGGGGALVISAYRREPNEFHSSPSAAAEEDDGNYAAGVRDRFFDFRSRARGREWPLESAPAGGGGGGRGLTARRRAFEIFSTQGPGFFA